MGALHCHSGFWLWPTGAWLLFLHYKSAGASQRGFTVRSMHNINSAYSVYSFLKILHKVCSLVLNILYPHSHWLTLNQLQEIWGLYLIMAFVLGSIKMVVQSCLFQFKISKIKTFIIILFLQHLLYRCYKDPPPALNYQIGTKCCCMDFNWIKKMFALILIFH